MSDSLQHLDVAKRVVRWHNRHWLARHIRISDVESIGVVVLPWAPGTATSADAEAARPAWKAWLQRLQGGISTLVSRLRRRPAPSEAASAAQASPSHEYADAPPLGAGAGAAGAASALVPAFTEAFAPGLTHEQVVSFARIHGREDSPAPPDWPCRQIRTESDVVEVWLYLLTAGITVEHHRPRLLLGPGPADPVLGRRILSPWRVSLAVVVPTLMLVLAGLALRPGSSGPSAHAPASAASAAPHAASAAAPASDAGHPPTHEAAASAAATAASGHPVPEAASAASSVSPAASGSVLPSLATASDHGADPAPAALPSASQAALPPARTSEDHPTPPPALHGAPSSAKTSPGRPEEPAEIRDLKPVLKDAPAREADAGQHFALMSRGPRTRAAAQELQARMEAAAGTLDRSDLPPQARVELMENRGSWHAVWWPFPDRQTAMQARWALALRGVTVDLVAF